jgi:hypothetical protein
MSADTIPFLQRQTHVAQAFLSAALPGSRRYVSDLSCKYERNRNKYSNSVIQSIADDLPE